MQIDEIYNLVTYILNKDVNGKQVKSTDFNMALKAVNIDLFKTRYGLPEEYVPGRPMPRQGYEVTQKITDDLRKFKVRLGGKDPLMAVGTDGTAPYPDDYIHYSSILRRYVNARNTVAYAKTEVVFDHQLGERLSNPNHYPTERFPVCVFYDDYMQFYPEGGGYVDFTYLRMPVTPYYATTVDPVADTEVYDPANSIQVEWPEDTHMDIVRRILVYVGLNLGNDKITAYAKQMEQAG